jgi:hypothetical protein
MFMRKITTRNGIVFVLGVMSLLIAMTNVGCGGTKTPMSAPTPSATFLRSIPLQTVSNNKILQGRLAIWRNLMPSTDPLNSGVIATFIINSEDDREVLTDIKIQKISLVSEESVWETTKVEFYSNTSQFNGTVRNGPLWEEGKTVDAVATFQDTVGNTQQIRAVGTIINVY